MAASRDFHREQRGVAIRMVAGLSVTILVSAACLHWEHGTTSPIAERLIDAATADVLVICWLAAAIGNVARLRFFSAEDIAGSGSGTATAEVSRANAVLQNTLEQVALAIPVHAALAVLVASSLPLIEASAALFAIGRLLFWIGYAKGAEARALGFALTFYPSLAGLIIAMLTAILSIGLQR